MCPRPLQRRDTDTHSQHTRRWATTQRGRPCRRQRRLSRHPPTREAVGPLALINHTVRRGWERKIRPASTGRRRARRADAGRKSPLLGGEKRRASLPPFFFFSFLGFEPRDRPVHRQGSGNERPRNPAPALSASVTDSHRPRPRWHRSRYATVELRGLSPFAPTPISCCTSRLPLPVGGRPRGAIAASFLHTGRRWLLSADS